MGQMGQMGQMRPMPAMGWRVVIRPMLLSLLLPAARLAAAPEPTVFAEDLSWGQVEIKLRAEPAQVRLDRDLVLTLTVATPPGITAELPDLRDRFKGFVLAEGFPREPVTLPDGRRSRDYRWRLTPGLESAYRLAPFAVQVRDASTTPPRESSFATRPVRFPAASLGIEAAGDVEVSPRPYWIPPTR
ncbi:MAG: hypothetical protein PHR35_23060, partial [Kiritimatiellae bacterium]|nr:hypothetical protein [Kiritimatiellia bacterium]